MSDSDTDNSTLPPPPPPLPHGSPGPHARTSSEDPRRAGAPLTHPPTANSTPTSSPILLGRMSRASTPWHPGHGVSSPPTPPITDTFEPIYGGRKKRKWRRYLVGTLTVIALVLAGFFGYYLNGKREVLLQHLHEHHHLHHENLTTTDNFISTLGEPGNTTEPVITTTTVWSKEVDTNEITPPPPPVLTQPIDKNESPVEAAPTTTETSQDAATTPTSTEAIMSIRKASKLPSPGVNPQLFEALLEGMHVPSNLLKRGSPDHELSPEEIQDMITNGRIRQEEAAAIPEDQQAYLAEHNVSESDEDASQTEAPTTPTGVVRPVETTPQQPQVVEVLPNLPASESVPTTTTAFEEVVPSEPTTPQTIPPQLPVLTEPPLLPVETVPSLEFGYPLPQVPPQPSWPEPQPSTDLPPEPSTVPAFPQQPTEPIQAYEPVSEDLPPQPIELPSPLPEFPGEEVSPQPSVLPPLPGEPSELPSFIPELPSEVPAQEWPVEPVQNMQQYPAEGIALQPEPSPSTEGVPNYTTEQVTSVAPAGDIPANVEQVPSERPEEVGQFGGEVPAQPIDTLEPFEMEIPIEFQDENSVLLNEINPAQAQQEIPEPAVQPIEPSPEDVPWTNIPPGSATDLSNPITQTETFGESPLNSNDVFGPEGGLDQTEDRADNRENEIDQQGIEEWPQASGGPVLPGEGVQAAPIDETQQFTTPAIEESTPADIDFTEGPLPVTDSQHVDESTEPNTTTPSTFQGPSSDETFETEEPSVDNAIETNEIGEPPEDLSKGLGPLTPGAVQPGIIQPGGGRLSGNFEGTFDDDDELKAAGQRRSAVFRNYLKPVEAALPGLKEVPLSVFPSRILSKFDVQESSPFFLPINNIPLQSISPLNGNVNVNSVPIILPEGIGAPPAVISEPVPTGSEKFFLPPASLSSSKLAPSPTAGSSVPINNGIFHTPATDLVASLAPPVPDPASNLAPGNINSLLRSLSLLQPLLPGPRPLSETIPTGLGLIQPLPAAPGLLPSAAAPGLLPSVAAPGLLPSPAAPGLLPLPAAPGLLPLPATPGLQPLPAAPGIQPVAQGVGSVPSFYNTLLELSKLIQAGKDDPAKAFGESSQTLAEEIKSKNGQVVESKSSKVAAAPSLSQPVHSVPVTPKPVLPSHPVTPKPNLPSPPASSIPPSPSAYYPATYQAPQHVTKASSQTVHPQPVQKTSHRHVVEASQPPSFIAYPSQENHKNPVSKPILNLLKPNATQSHYPATSQTSHATPYSKEPVAPLHEQKPSLPKYPSAPRPAPKNYPGTAEQFESPYVNQVAQANVQNVPLKNPAIYHDLSTSSQPRSSQKYYQPSPHAAIKPETSHQDLSQNFYVKPSAYPLNYIPANPSPNLIYRTPLKSWIPNPVAYRDQRIQSVPFRNNTNIAFRPSPVPGYSNQLAAPSKYPLKATPPRNPKVSQLETPLYPVSKAPSAIPAKRLPPYKPLTTPPAQVNPKPVPYAAIPTAPVKPVPPYKPLATSPAQVNPKTVSYASRPTAPVKPPYFPTPQPIVSYQPRPKVTYPYTPRSQVPPYPSKIAKESAPASFRPVASQVSAPQPNTQKPNYKPFGYFPQPTNANFSSLSYPRFTPIAQPQDTKNIHSVNQPKPSTETKSATSPKLTKPDVITSTNPSTGAQKTFVPTDSVLKPQVVSYTPRKPFTEIRTQETQTSKPPTRTPANGFDKTLRSESNIVQKSYTPLTHTVQYQTQPSTTPIPSLTAKTAELFKKIFPDTKKPTQENRQATNLNQNPALPKSQSQPVVEKPTLAVPSIEKVLSALKQETPLPSKPTVPSKPSPATPTLLTPSANQKPNIPPSKTASYSQDRNFPQVQLTQIPSVKEPTPFETPVPQKSTSLWNFLQPQIISPPVAPSQLINVFQIPSKPRSESLPIRYAALTGAAPSPDTKPSQPEPKPVASELPKPLPKTETPQSPPKIVEYKPLKPEEVITPRTITVIAPSNQPSAKPASSPADVQSNPVKTPQTQSTTVQAKPNIATPVTKEQVLKKPEVVESNASSNSPKSTNLPNKDTPTAYLRTLPISNLKSDTPVLLPPSYLNWPLRFAPTQKLPQTVAPKSPVNPVTPAPPAVQSTPKPWWENNPQTPVEPLTPAPPPVQKSTLPWWQNTPQPPVTPAPPPPSVTNAPFSWWQNNPQGLFNPVTPPPSVNQNTPLPWWKPLLKSAQ